MNTEEIEILSKYFKDEQLQFDEAVLTKFSLDDRRSELVIFPETNEQIQNAIKLAIKLNKTVAVFGNNKLAFSGALPQKFDWALSVSRMNKVISHDVADFSVTVQAGILLSEIQKLISKKKQFLPLDPMGGYRQTIGAITAMNDAGSLRFHFGTCQDLILGMKVILPDGRCIKTGGKTVKNVAGYNLSRLFTGSLGTLGVISEITFKLSPAPPFQRTILIGFDSYQKAGEAAHWIRTSNMVFDRLDFFNKRFQQTLLPKQREIDAKSEYFLLINASGNKKAVENSLLRLKKELTGRTCFVEVSESKGRPNIWQRFIELPIEETFGKGLLWLQIFAPRGQIWKLIKNIEEKFPESYLHGFAGNGILNIFTKPSGKTRNEELILKIEEMRQFCASQSGYLIGKIVPTELRNASLVWGKNNDILPLMNSVKQKLDPNRVMVSGRFFGGI